MAHIVVADIDPIIQYNATGGQTVFTVPFPFFTEASLNVYLTPVGQTADDATDILVLNTDYTVVGEGNVDGATKEITLSAGSYPSGATLNDVITIRRNEPIERTADLANQGNFSSETYNDEQDLLIMILQQIRENIGRSIEKGVTGGNWDAESLIIKRVADPVDNQDAATKTWTLSQIIEATLGGGTLQLDATNVSYDNATSGLTADEVQAAIDELENEIDDLPVTTKGTFASGSWVGYSTPPTMSLRWQKTTYPPTGRSVVILSSLSTGLTGTANSGFQSFGTIPADQRPDVDLAFPIEVVDNLGTLYAGRARIIASTGIIELYRDGVSGSFVPSEGNMPTGSGVGFARDFCFVYETTA